MPLENVFIHTDSAVLLFQIASDAKNLKQYVANRIKKIQASGLHILFVNGNNNPSDLVTKEKSISTHVNNPFWLSGPIFLTHKTEKIVEDGNIKHLLNEKLEDNEAHQAIQKEQLTKTIQTLNTSIKNAKHKNSSTQKS